MPSLLSDTEEHNEKKAPSRIHEILLNFLISVLSSFLVVFLSFNYLLPIISINQGIEKQTTGSGIKTETVYQESEDETIQAVDKVSPAVVSIIVKQTADTSSSNLMMPSDPFFRFFGDDFFYNKPETDENGQYTVARGTGFVVSADGYIITNKHVVSQPDATYTVVLNNGTEYEGKVLDTDPLNDIAVMKIEAQNLTSVELGDSDGVKIGQTVIAIGNSLGEYNNSVTKGVVSAIDRSITASDGLGSEEALENIIQTDAAINPGNSGGPLIDLEGKVIGINTAIDKSGQSIGFALPINSAKYVVESIKTNGKVIRPYLGVRYILINDSIKTANNLSVNYGALVVRGETQDQLAIIPGSPADKAGLVENDIVLEVNGVQLNQDNSLIKELQKYKPNETIELKVLSKGEEKLIKVTLGESNT